MTAWKDRPTSLRISGQRIRRISLPTKTPCHDARLSSQLWLISRGGKSEAIETIPPLGLKFLNPLLPT